MPMLRLHHVQWAIPPGREDAARAFYAGLGGMDEVHKPAHRASLDRSGCMVWRDDPLGRCERGFVADPSGYRIQLMEEARASAGRAAVGQPHP